VLEKMLATGKGFESILGIRRQWYMEKIGSDPDWARDFTHMLYYHHLNAAKVLAGTIDLTGYRNLLDVGGGSGVMSLALARRFPDLTATVLDLEPVCRTAKQIIRRERMTGRVKTRVGDMTREIPSGYDVIMFCDAGDPSVQTLSHVFELLPDRGMIVLADLFSSEDYTEPFLRLMWQLRSTRPWLVTHKEMLARLRQTGFKSVKRHRLTTDMWVLTGVKR
jgi:predicted O-methyltransferase YrrM